MSVGGIQRARVIGDNRERRVKKQDRGFLLLAADASAPVTKSEQHHVFERIRLTEFTLHL
jgi:hypothetical protein